MYLVLTKVWIFWERLPCFYAGILGTGFAAPLAVVIENDWFARALIMLGAGGLAAVIVSYGKFKVAAATARKTDADSVSSQFVLIIERLQQENREVKQYWRNMFNDLSAITQVQTITKHAFAGEREAMLLHLQLRAELLKERGIVFPEFRGNSFSVLTLEEDKLRAKTIGIAPEVIEEMAAKPAPRP